MRNQQTKKLIGASLSGAIFSLILLVYIIIICNLQITNTEERLPIGLFLFILIILLTLLIAIISNLIMRIKEIKSKEEEEASKY